MPLIQIFRHGKRKKIQVFCKRELYIDDFEEIKDGIEKVFEKAYAFTNEISIDDF